ncbi:ASCH domain-containing protein [Enterovibrio makurazakiensis]|uniref:ASCH domain-containing protein n=1 Tax=Enterovibrio gelatinilyticus TaxID=2899819 RepID=A0ABT5R2F5_9GAMM|nr:ASCH domain-containing protein [Enterovibrio sp. ZSDZ42]MDD1794453.1 ASCH domain-containing protein [Enterovibrio sp. ZSDZ42]
MDKKHQQYLDDYLITLPETIRAKHTSFSADYFCSDEYNANICADLILRGEKRASCSMAYWYTHEGEPMAEVGHLQVVTDWAGDPVCIIEFTSVSECRYKDVTAEFAASEGEGDKTLAWWRDAHWKFFSLECEELGITPSEEMLLIQERFKVVYPLN